jgi:predicted ArsR family transcriptional regulator
MTLEGRIYNADRAKEVLENEAFQQVFADAKQEITEQWTKSPARDQDGREKLWLMLSLLNKLEAMLQSSLDSGKLAKAELQHQQTMLDRAKSLAGMR